jgi:hypothetical protein
MVVTPIFKTHTGQSLNSFTRYDIVNTGLHGFSSRWKCRCRGCLSGRRSLSIFVQMFAQGRTFISLPEAAPTLQLRHDPVNEFLVATWRE